MVLGLKIEGFVTRNNLNLLLLIVANKELFKKVLSHAEIIR